MPVPWLPLLVACASPAPSAPPAAGVTDTAFATVAELGAAMASGELTSHALVQASLLRLDALASLHAVTTIAPDALQTALALDRERAERGPRGPLHGIPVLVKDNIDVAGLPTTAGSLALLHHVPAVDAPAVAGVRAAGAVILGKTNLSEWANLRSLHSSSGWSAVGGQARNPWDPSRSPCGSSSGSAIVVAAGIVPLAIGTETDGSIVCPAAMTGVVGIKPTVGLVSQAGIVPISHSQDTAGPLARTVADAALLLVAMIAPDEARRALAVPDASALEGARIGVVRSLAGYHPGTDERFEAAIADLRAHGARIVDPVDLQLPPDAAEDELEVLLVEFREGLAAYLASTDPALGVRSIEDVIAFNRDHADTELAYFGQDLLERAATRGPSSDPAFVARRAALQAAVRDALDSVGVDALIAPTTGPAWTIDLVNGDHFLGGSTTPAAIAGAAAITVPMGRTRGLPVGLSFFGPRDAEPRLIAIAAAYEAATRHQARPPEP